MDRFRKTEDCPPSEDLLAFERGELGVVYSAEVRRHVIGCEFCTAEVSFYGKYPPSDVEKVTIDKIPQPLFQLAESLMHRNRHLDALYKLVRRSG